MTHTISSASGSGNRPRLCRSDHLPNILEYIDTTLNDSFFSRLNIESRPSTTTDSVSCASDQFGNTIVDQYLLYILCQKLHPNRTESIYRSLHQLFCFHGKISKSFFEYLPTSSIRANYPSLFANYTSFIWNEFDLDVLLELACFLLKYRLRDIFLPMTTTKSDGNSNRQKIIGYFLETIVIYYLVINHQQFFISSRSKEMLFPYPPVISGVDEETKDKDMSIFDKFLRQLSENGEVSLDSRQIRVLLQSDAYQFLNKKLEHKKIGFLNFFDTILRFQLEHSCRSLKSLCRLSIKMHLKQYPNDLKELPLYPSLNDQLLTYLTYENKIIHKMSFSTLPDVALIRIFRTLDHIELVRLYHSFHSSKRLQNLIENSSCLWTDVHIKCTVDYHLFTYFARLLISNASRIRHLTIDELDLTCRKILLGNKFSLRECTQLEQLIIHDEHLCKTLQSLHFCSSTLRILRLTNEHTNLEHLNHLNHLHTLQITLYSIDTLQNRFEQLTNLHLKLMFDYDHQSDQIFSHLPRRSLQILTLKFLILNNDFNFSHQFNQYLDHCSHLHTLELFYLHGMCPVGFYINLDYSKYQRMILVNICQIKQMRNLIELNEYDLPLEYLQFNSTLNINSSSSHIQTQIWSGREVISLDYLQCVTTSMELFNEMNVIWSDKNQITQSFESYILRSIYNVPYLISSIRKLCISKFELSVNGLVILMTTVPLVTDLIITDGRIDQMGSGISDLEKIIRTTRNVPRSNIRTILMNTIQLSRRTVVNVCLITPQLKSLITNDVTILDRIPYSQPNPFPNLPVLLKEIAQLTDQFKWNELTSLTFGKNLLNRQNLFTFIPSDLNTTYAINLNHLCLIIHDQTLLNPHDQFLKSMKKLIKIVPKLTSFILEFTKQYEGQFRLRNQLEILFESDINKKVYVYPTIHDRACRFCFDTVFFGKDEDDDRTSSSQQYRTFCGIPLFQLPKQRKLTCLS